MIGFPRQVKRAHMVHARLAFPLGSSHVGLERAGSSRGRPSLMGALVVGILLLGPLNVGHAQDDPQDDDAGPDVLLNAGGTPQDPAPTNDQIVPAAPAGDTEGDEASGAAPRIPPAPPALAEDDGTGAIPMASIAQRSGRKGTVEGPVPDWKWRQILSIPRIGGRMTAIAIDPNNPRKVYVGTEEGTILRSNDTGITWNELEPNPSVVTDRSVSLIAPGLPELGASTPSPLTIFFDPPFYQYFDRVFVTGVQLVMFSTFPSDMVVGFVPVGTGVPQDLLMLAERSRRAETNPVRRIAVCPEAEYPLIVATKKELYGSQDDGLTYVRLFGLPGIDLLHVVCSAANSREIYVATGFGLFRSLDGGLRFDQLLVGWPGAPTTAISSPNQVDAEGNSIIIAAWGSGVWAGNPDSDAGLRMLYPDFQNNDTAPWTDVRWIDVSEKGHIWMASDDGIRVSFDGGRSWVAEARSLFERQTIRQVVVGPSDDGGERIAVMTREWVYASDDDGETWHPYFNGIGPRAHKQLAVSPMGDGQEAGWWMVTAGEVWTTIPEQEVPASEQSQALKNWAEYRLKHTKSLPEVMDAVLEKTGFDRASVNRITAKSRKRYRAPIFSMRFTYNDLTEARQRVGLPVTNSSRQRSAPYWELLVQMNWRLTDLPLASEEYSGVQNRMAGLWRQVRFIAQDSWHERYLLLRRISSNEVDRLQAEVLKTRVEGLEAILETWMRSSILRGDAARSAPTPPPLSDAFRETFRETFREKS